MNNIFFNKFNYDKKDNKYLFIFIFFPLSISLMYGFFSNPVYQSEVILSTSNSSSSSISSLGSSIGGGLVSSFFNSETTLVQKTLATSQSKSFLNDFVKKYDLFKPLGLSDEDNQWEIQEKMLRTFTLEKINRSSLYSLKLEMNDAAVTSTMANAFIDDLNLFMRNKELEKINANILLLENKIIIEEKKETKELLYNILGSQINLNVVIASDPEFVFSVIDKATPSISYIWPNYLILFLISLFFSIISIYFFYLNKVRINNYL